MERQTRCYFCTFPGLEILGKQSRSLKLQSMKVIEKIYVMTQLSLYSNFIHDRSLKVIEKSWNAWCVGHGMSWNYIDGRKIKDSVCNRAESTQ